jgi:hypothetical protein
MDCSSKLKLTTAAFGLLVCLTLSVISAQADSVTAGGTQKDSGAGYARSASQFVGQSYTTLIAGGFDLRTFSEFNFNTSTSKGQVTFSEASLRERPITFSVEPTGPGVIIETPTNAPEPMSMALLGTGLVGVATLLRWRKRKPNLDSES